MEIGDKEMGNERVRSGTALTSLGFHALAMCVWHFHMGDANVHALSVDHLSCL